MTNTDFKRRALGPWTWFLWFSLTMALSAYTIYSTHELWPELFWMAVLGAAAIIAASFYTAAHIQEIEPTVRNAALAAKLIMLVAMVFNVAMHGAASRDVGNVAKQRAEQIEAQERANKLADAEAERSRKVLEAAGQTIKRATDYNNNAAWQARRSGTNTPPPVRLNMPNLNTGGSGIKIDATLASAAVAAAAWFWWVFSGFLAELIAAIAGASYVLHRRIEDRNANGIPDWIENLYAMNPAIVQERFPDFYRVLSGKAGPTGREEFPRELDTDAPKA